METLDLEVISEKAQRLEIVRSELNINKSELARRIDSPQSHISKVLKGEAPLGDLLSDKIVRRLHINPSWWETGRGEIFSLTRQTSQSIGTMSDSVNANIGGDNNTTSLSGDRQEIDRLKKELDSERNKRLELQEQMIELLKKLK